MRVRFPRSTRGFWPQIELRSILVLIILLSAGNLFGQTSEKPKAFLFDEFGLIPDRQIKARTKKLRETIQEKAWSKEALRAYIIMIRDEKTASPKRLEKVIIDALYEDCYDCMGFGPGITFVRAGKAKLQKVQFWLVPAGADPPKIDSEEN